MTTQEAPPSALMTAVLRPAMWVLLYVVPLGVALRPLFDEDVWWHIRAGQWMIENRALPETDPFSRYGQETGSPWIAYSWLFEVLVAGFYNALGPAGISLFRGLATLAVVLALHRFVARREPRFLVAIVWAGLAVLAILPLLSERPWLFTIVFSTLTLDTILDLRAGVRGRAVWLLPLLYVVWANLHIQFVYGLFLLGLACVAPLIDWSARVLRQEDTADVPGLATWRLLAGLTAACTAATLLTPYHVHLYEVVRQYATQRAPLVHVFEMQSLEFRGPWDWAVLFLACAAAFALGRRGRPSAFDVLLLAAAAWFAFRSRRDAWFMALAAPAVLLPAARLVPELRSFLPGRRQAVLVAGLLCLAVGYLWATRTTGDVMRGQLARTYPVAAVEHVRARGYPGPLYNSYNWGGFLMCHLPELPVSIDGRANLHGDARLDQSMKTWIAQPGWDADPDLWAARLVIAESHSPLVSLLRLDSRFEVVYADATATVFLARPRPDGYAGR